jgi:hypothetical protein
MLPMPPHAAHAALSAKVVVAAHAAHAANVVVAAHAAHATDLDDRERDAPLHRAVVIKLPALEDERLLLLDADSLLKDIRIYGVDGV